MQTLPEITMDDAWLTEPGVTMNQLGAIASSLDAEDALLAWCYGASVPVDIYLELSEAISTAVKTVMAKHEAQEKAAANYVSPAMSDHCATAAWYGRGEVAEDAERFDGASVKLLPVVKPALAGFASIAADSRYQGMGFNGEA